MLCAVFFGCRRAGLAIEQLLGTGADDDPAASGLGQRAGGVAVDLDRLGGGGDDVGARQAAQLALGDLPDQGVVEDEFGSELAVGAEAGKGLVQILLPGFGVLGLDPVPAALQPAADTVDRLGGADQRDRVSCPKPMSTSCDLLIFVEEAADAVMSLDLAEVGR